MEVGAVKQAFNNEVILLKKNLNQAKIQIIHKLTRKAKTFTEKKAPENIKVKLKRKAESAVSEVLVIKKIKPKDIAKFIVTHNGELKDYLNKPIVDQDKACARLLLHKSLQDKYKFIRQRFSNIPIKDLFMSRQERRKLKKEEKEKQKKKKVKNSSNKVMTSEGDWDVEDVMDDGAKQLGDIDGNVSDEIDDNDSDEEEEPLDSVKGSSECDERDISDGTASKDTEENVIKIANNDLSDQENDSDIQPETGKFVKLTPTKAYKNSIINDEKSNVKRNDTPSMQTNKNPENALLNRNKQVEKKLKDSKKNKNFNEKILLRKFKKDADDTAVVGKKVVDPFFITSTGENYLSVAEPRPPDEVKEVHKQGNRKLRRAAMFGHVPKIKPRRNDFRTDNFKHNDFSKNFGSTSKFNNNVWSENNNENTFNDRKFNYKKPNYDNNTFNKKNDDKPEKLHPSWEAKKKMSSILPFQGKKIVFDDS